MKIASCLGQPSWKIASDRVEAQVTRLGGHLAPVRFRFGKRVVEPFSVAPWAEEKLSSRVPPLLRALRGDFFCAPFGGNEEPWKGEAHPPHGETAGAPWRFESLQEESGATRLHLSLDLKVRGGRADKYLELRAGETAIYSRHVLSKMSGPMCFGQHAMLKFPDEPGSGHITTSRISFGQVVPTFFEDPAKGGYTSLKQGATFRRLDQVPLADGKKADLRVYPARRGFEDLVMIAHQDKPDFAWVAAAFPKQRYVWFALKDPRVLRSTVLWLSNGGRHYAPWSGRHVNVMGLEDVTAYFHLGLAASAEPNPVSERGVPTTIEMNPKKPLTVNYIMALAEIPADFASVQKIVPEKTGVTLLSASGHRISVPLHLPFLYETAP